ncbi:MAG: 2,3-bisphosphoglycerate-independent phosphoglycerate mutase [Oscillospiraceae bacterium]|jgi:2,3-bisphosphoglycerate-independent phosphoglycerate mutase
MTKYILVIGDGMADNPVPELGGRTPLEAAYKPNIDELSKTGELGHVLTVPRGLPPGSDTAILSIFGCDPRVYYTGRSPLEAAGSGVNLSPGDVSYRCNMVSLEDNDLPFEEKKILSHSAGSIDGDESIELIEYLFSHPRFKPMAEKAKLSIYPNPSFRHIAVQAGADVSGLVAIPPHDHLGEVIGPLLPSGCPNALVLLELMKLANEILPEHPINIRRRKAGKMPANGIWLWAEGTAVELPDFVKTYGKNGSVISAVPLAHGIAALTGLGMTSVEGATGELDTNYEGKVDAALDILRGGADFVAVHIEAPDECTHNGDLNGKIEAIERLDSRVVGPLRRELDSAGWDWRMLILSDHKTLTSTRGHDGDPVPYIIYDSRVKTGSGLPYTESNGEKGQFIEDGTQLMNMLFSK